MDRTHMFKRLDEVKRIWKPGMSASMIADAVNFEASRNAIIGMFIRHKDYLAPCRLMDAPEIRKVRVANGEKTQAERVRTTKQRTATSDKFKAARQVQRFVPKKVNGHADANAYDKDAFTMPQGSKMVSLMDSKPHHCKWVHGEGASMMYCGETVEPGKSWCLPHCKVGYTLTVYNAISHRYERNTAKRR